MKICTKNKSELKEIKDMLPNYLEEKTIPTNIFILDYILKGVNTILRRKSKLLRRRTFFLLPYKEILPTKSIIRSDGRRQFLSIISRHESKPPHNHVSPSKSHGYKGYGASS